jgi:hypothetical protein
MVLDPQSGKPARIGYTVKPDGTKERIFKISRHHDTKKVTKAAAPKAEAKTETAEKATKAGKK